MTRPSLFAAPIEAELISTGLPVLLLGVTALGEGLVIGEDGMFAFIVLTDITVNWRYSWRDHRWVETGDINGEEVDPTDGGADLSGPVPDADDVSAGDPLDPEGGQAPGDPGDVDSREARTASGGTP